MKCCRETQEARHGATLIDGRDIYSMAGKRHRRSLLLLASTVCLTACELFSCSVFAATVGYWRFESDAFLGDTGGHAAGPFNLTNGGTTNNNDVYSLPTTGPGAAIPRTIPRTGAANASGAWLTRSEQDLFTVPFNSAFAPLSFTIEAMIHYPSSGGGTIFSARRTDERSFEFYVTQTFGLVLWWRGDSGGGYITQSSTSASLSAPQSGKDYYVAVVFKYTGGPAEVTFYQKNLTDGGSLLSSTHTLNIYYCLPPQAPPTIGQSPEWNSTFNGLIDEVRFSDAVLTSSQLLISTASVAPEIVVQGNSVSIVDGDNTPSLTDHTDFGDALVAGGTVERTYTIRNTGTATLNLSGSPRVAVSGTHAADFTVTTQPAATVAAGGTTTFQVTFDPLAVGTRTAALSIANNDANENPYTYSILGNGTTPPEMQAPEIGSGGAAVIQWTSYTNHLYTVHHSTNLLSGFTVRQGNIQGIPPMNSYTDTVNGMQLKFWKVTTEE